MRKIDEGKVYRQVYAEFEPIIPKVDCYKADYLEKKIEKLISNKEPIGKDVPLRYTERKEGIIKDYDIRTDRFEVAMEAMDKVHKTNIAKRDNVIDFEKGKQNLGKNGETPANPSDLATSK